MNKLELYDKLRAEIPIALAANEVGIDAEIGRDMSVRCPFHGDGVDNKTSAKIYADTNTMWCWTCQRVYDPLDIIVIGMDLKHADAAEFLIKKFMTEEYKKELLKTKKNIEVSKVQAFLRKKIELVSNNIMKNRNKFSLTKYMKAFFLIDRLMFQVGFENLDKKKIIKGIIQVENNIGNILRS